MLFRSYTNNPSPIYFAKCPSKRRMTVAQVSRYAWMTMRNSSGSSCCESTVEPTRSQNITVSCRRSATVSSEFWVSSFEFFDFLFSFAFSLLPFDFCLLIFDLLVSAVPHFPQNFAAGRISWPQLGQTCASFVPHSSQKFIPGGFSTPQFRQRIQLLYCIAGRWTRRSTSLKVSSQLLVVSLWLAPFGRFIAYGLWSEPCAIA